MVADLQMRACQMKHKFWRERKRTGLPVAGWTIKMLSDTNTRTKMQIICRWCDCYIKEILEINNHKNWMRHRLSLFNFVDTEIEAQEIE